MVWRAELPGATHGGETVWFDAARERVCRCTQLECAAARISEGARCAAARGRRVPPHAREAVRCAAARGKCVALHVERGRPAGAEGPSQLEPGGVNAAEGAAGCSAARNPEQLNAPGRRDVFSCTRFP